MRMSWTYSGSVLFGMRAPVRGGARPNSKKERKKQFGPLPFRFVWFALDHWYSLARIGTMGQPYVNVAALFVLHAALFYSAAGTAYTWLLAMPSARHYALGQHLLLCRLTCRLIRSGLGLAVEELNFLLNELILFVRDVLSALSESADDHGCFDFGLFCGVLLTFVGFTTLPFLSLFTPFV